jgi:hypothetical protein
LKPVRFIICSRTDNPVLALFSDKIERILAAYTTIQSEPQLFADISIYWKQVLRKIAQEIKNMCTREDFLRDYPDTDVELRMWSRVFSSGWKNWPRRNINKALNKALNKGHPQRNR